MGKSTLIQPSPLSINLVFRLMRATSNICRIRLMGARLLYVSKVKARVLPPGKTCHLAAQEDVSSCWTRRPVFLLNRKTFLLVPQEDMFFFQQEDMSSGSTRRHVFLFNKKTCLLVGQEDMSSCWRRRHVFLFNKKTCLLVKQEDMSSCWTRRQWTSMDVNGDVNGRQWPQKAKRTKHKRSPWKAT